MSLLSASHFKTNVLPFTDINTAQGRLRTCCTSCVSNVMGLCAGLPGKTLETVYQMARTTHFPAHASLFNQGDEASRIFIITKGIVRRADRPCPDSLHAVNADAIGEVVACQIPARHFMQLAESKPEVLKLLNTAILSDLNTTQEQLASVGRHNAQERVATLLVNLRNRWRAIDNSSHYVALPMTRADIADYCGLSVESVSRTLADLARQKIIVIVPNGIRILNTAGITALTQGVASLA